MINNSSQAGVVEPSALEQYIRQKRQSKPVLLMTHIVLGYPSFEASLEIIDEMVAAGVDLIELQIPFSEPIADGPVILHANQQSLERGATLQRCFETAQIACERYDIPILFMTYYNIIYKYGLQKMTDTMLKLGVQGSILPDLPYEEGAELLTAMHRQQLNPILLYAPTSTDARMRAISEQARGFIYCIARKGVTGSHTALSQQVEQYLARCRQNTHLPLAAGLGIQNAEDVRYLCGKVDIAVVGSQTLRVVEEQGVSAVGPFIKSLVQQ